MCHDLVPDPARGPVESDLDWRRRVIVEDVLDRVTGETENLAAVNVASCAECEAVLPALFACWKFSGEIVSTAVHCGARTPAAALEGPVPAVPRAPNSSNDAVEQEILGGGWDDPERGGGKVAAGVVLGTDAVDLVAAGVAGQTCCALPGVVAPGGAVGAGMFLIPFFVGEFSPVVLFGAPSRVDVSPGVDHPNEFACSSFSVSVTFPIHTRGSEADLVQELCSDPV